MYGFAHDVHNFSLLDDIKTLPWMLQQAGYRTALGRQKTRQARCAAAVRRLAGS
jgi:hypothetical protein